MTARPDENVSLMIRTLDTLYTHVIKGVVGTGPVWDLVEDYRAMPGTTTEQVNSFVRWQATKAAATGFATGMIGVVGVPAGISTALYLQLRTIAGVACLCGFDPGHDTVRTMCYVCLCGDTGVRMLREAGVQVGRQAALALVRRVPGRVLIEINKKVGFRLVTKFGQKGLVNLVRFVPVAGGLVGGAVDGAACAAAGKIARNVFLS